MKKLLLLVLMFVIVLTGCGSHPIFETTSSQNFTVYYTAADQAPAEDVLAALEASYEHITNDLKPHRTSDYKVRIYPTLEEFHSAISIMNPPAWAVGVAWGENELRMVSPLTSGREYNTMLQVAVHEFAHCVTLRLGKNNPYSWIWLWEGIALFEAGQFVDLTSLPYMQSGQYPNFLSITAHTQEIYQLGYSIVEYIVETWGMEYIRELVLNDGSVKVVLGLTDEEFYHGWYTFVSQKYLRKAS